MNILVIGDIVGSPGRQTVKSVLPKLIKEKQLDFVVANGENAAGGSGMIPRIAEELFSYGVDVITMGDHVWKQKAILPLIEEEERLLRPLNFPPMTPGKGYVVVTLNNGLKIGVINLLGRVFMQPCDCPFRLGNEIVRKIREETSIIIVDFHAEATSEKIAMGWYLNGLVSAVCGTHTHVQTADEKVLSSGTAYITDVGMTGPFNSVLGRDVDSVLKRFVTLMPSRFTIAKEDCGLSGVVIAIDEKTGKAKSIERIARASTQANNV